jgi:hypothetical protein
VGSRRLLEVSVDLLNEDRFGLVSGQRRILARLQDGREHTWMFAVQRVVMELIFEPDTPGGLRLSMDCRIASSSATADDMMWSSITSEL